MAIVFLTGLAGLTTGDFGAAVACEYKMGPTLFVTGFAQLASFRIGDVFDYFYFADFFFF